MKFSWYYYYTSTLYFSFLPCQIEFEKNGGRNGSGPKQEDSCHSRTRKSRMTSSSSSHDHVISSLPLDEEAPVTKLNRRHSMLSHSSVKRLFNWKARSGIGDRRVSEPNNPIRHSNEYFSFSTSEEDNQLGSQEAVSVSSSVTSEPYNTTMQCYCGQNSCHLCNLLLNLQITNTGVDWNETNLDFLTKLLSANILYLYIIQDL